MFAIDGGDDGDDRGEHQEAAIAFVGFDNEIFPATNTGRGAGLIDFATNDERGIEMSCGKNGSHHGGGGGLAMRASNGNSVFQAHQFGEHLRTGNHRDFLLVRFDHFRIVGFYGGRNYDDVRSLDIVRFMAFVNGGTEVLQTFRDGRGFGVRAGDGIAESEQDFSNATHTDATNANQVDALKIAKRYHHDRQFLPKPL